MFFFLLPVGVDYRARRYPVVTFTLMGICVAVYLITLVLRLAIGPGVTEWVMENLWLTPSESHFWAYITSLFVHEGFFHLAGNMVYLFLFGACVEDVIGRPRFIAFYLLCGLASEFMHIAMFPGHFASDVPLGGASGAISGCIGGFLILFLRTRIEFKYLFFLFFKIWTGEFFLPAWIVISFWFGKDLLAMLLVAAVGEGGGGVAFGAHVGGTLCGLGLIAIEKRFKRALPAEEIEEEPVPAIQQAQMPIRQARAPVRIQLKSTPVTETVEPPTIFLFSGGAQSGPFTHSHIQEMFLSGAIPADAFYWQEGMADWQSAEELRPTGGG